MREEKLPRLNDWHVKTKDPHYIHYYFLIRDITEAIKNYAFGDLLDLGCGNKPYETLYQPKTRSQVGCDVIQSDKNRVDVLCPVTDLKFHNEHFDTILCTQVLEHVFEHDRMMCEIYRVLKPGGHIILTVPFAWELHEEPYDFFRYSKHALREILERSGFEIVYIKPNGGKWACIFQMFINTVHSTFKYKTFRSKLVKIVFIELRLTWLLSKIAIWIDQRYPDNWWTLNYITVAKKKKSN